LVIENSGLTRQTPKQSGLDTDQQISDFDMSRGIPGRFRPVTAVSLASVA